MQSVEQHYNTVKATELKSQVKRHYMPKICSHIYTNIVNNVPHKDGGLRYRTCLFGLVVKYNFKPIFFQLNIFDNVIIKIYKRTISN